MKGSLFIMHIAVTVAVVVLSIVSLLVIAIGAKKDNRKTIDNQHEKNNRKNVAEKYPVLNRDRDTATVLVTLPDGSKGWTDGLGNGYIR